MTVGHKKLESYFSDFSEMGSHTYTFYFVTIITSKTIVEMHTKTEYVPTKYICYQGWDLSALRIPNKY